MSDWQQMGIANVANRMRDLESTVLSLADDVPMLVEAVSRLNDDIERLIDSRRETRSTVSQHDDTLRELAGTVKRLAVRVSWIEEHLRSSGSARTVDLDHPDPDLVALAATAEAGRAAAGVLLSSVERATLVAELAGHRSLLARHRDTVGEVLAACEQLANGGPDGAARRRLRADYHTARARLAEDDLERDRTATVLAAGERADRELLTRLRTRIASAVGDGAMLPAWLTGPLGPMPAAGSAPRWTDVAAGLLAYRITYAVTDPADAIGEVPAGAGERRRRWHADLGRGVRELRR